MADEEKLTVRALNSLRKEVRGINERLDQTNERLDQTNERLDQTNERLDQTNERLDHHIEQTRRCFVSLETRLASELVSVGTTLVEVRDLLRDRLDQRDRLDEHERRIGALERRLEG